MACTPHQRTILVTGATRGIGQSTAALLAARGCRVVVHGRDESSARASCARLAGYESVLPVWGDMGDLKQVRLLADQVIRTTSVLDGLILNAGVFQQGGQTSADGFELDFAVNYLSHLLLTHLLLDQLRSVPESRVVFVSSSAYINGQHDLAHLGSQHLHDPLMAYATSKLLCLMAALELARRLSGSRVCVNACNPGPTCTQLLTDGRAYGWRASGGAPRKAAKRIEWLIMSSELNGISGCYFNGRRTPNVPKRMRDPAVTSAAYEASMRLCVAYRTPLNTGCEGTPRHLRARIEQGNSPDDPGASDVRRSARGKKLTAEGMQALTDMPNIGREVAGLLSRAGISTPEQLARWGAVEAALKIRGIRPDAPPCRSMVAGLHGAIRGVRWHRIPKAEREALWKEFEAQTSPCTVRARAARP